MTMTSKEKRKRTCLAPSAHRLALTGWVTVLGYLTPLPCVVADPAEHVADRLLVKPKADVRESSVHALFSKHGAKQTEIIHQLDLRVVTVKPGQLEQVMERLRRSRHIEFVEPDWILAPATVPTDPYYGIQWHLPRINAPTAWDTTTGSSAVTIAILDSGVDGSHPDLAPLVVPGWNSHDNNADTRDITGHGTGVAGAAAAAANNGMGVVGVAWDCRLMPLRVSDTNGNGSSSAIAGALVWAADHGARVANLSFSGAAKLPSIISAAQYFQSKGGVVTVAAGNAGTFDSSPINPYFLVVSATDANDLLASWSNTGNNIDLSAPGVVILTTMQGGGYGSGSGTSFSAPVVAGAAALVISANPTLPGAQVQAILKQTADDLGSAGWDTHYGAGRLNVGSAVLLAANSTPRDSNAPTVQIIAPLNGASIERSVKVSVVAADNVGVTRIDLYTDGKFYASSTLATTEFTWNTSKLTQGTHILRVWAYDAAGNVGASAVVSVHK